jgi:hypothetical protein
VRANSEALDKLHATIAETLEAELKNYRSGVYDKVETVTDGEGSAEERRVKTPVPAALIAATIKFLKDNGATEPEEDEPDPSDTLADELPDFRTGN